MKKLLFTVLSIFASFHLHATEENIVNLICEKGENPYELYSPLTGLAMLGVLTYAQYKILIRIRNEARSEAYARNRDAELAELKEHEVSWFGGRDERKKAQLSEERLQQSITRKKLENVRPWDLYRKLISGTDANFNKNTLPFTYMTLLDAQNESKKVAQEIEQLFRDSIEFAENTYRP